MANIAADMHVIQIIDRHSREIVMMIVRVFFAMLVLTVLMPAHAAERKLIKFDLIA